MKRVPIKEALECKVLEHSSQDHELVCCVFDGDRSDLGGDYRTVEVANDAGRVKTLVIADLFGHLGDELV